MGAAGSSEAKAAAPDEENAPPRSRGIFGVLRGSSAARVDASQEFRTKVPRKAVSGNVLVLGMKGAGKTTLARQMREVVTPFLTQDERKQYVWDIQKQILADMQLLTKEAESFGFIWGSKECKDVADQCRSGKITHAQLTDLGMLWGHEPFRDFVSQQSHIGVAPEDNMKYFFENMDRFAKEGYTPSIEEVMMHREVRNSGQKNSAEVWRLNVKDDEHINMFHRLNLVDAGGAEEHRRAWHRHFDDAVVLFYVVSMADYSHVDPTTRRNVLTESFVVYRSLVNSLWLEEGKIKVILVLAKSDLFQAKISSDSIEKYFPHGFAGVPPVTGPDGYRHSKAGAFIKSVFRKITPPKILDRLEVHELNLAPYPPAKDSSNGDTHLGISPVRLLYQSLKKVVVHEGKLKKTVHHILKARKSMRFTGTASLGQGMDSSEILKIAQASLHHKAHDLFEVTDDLKRSSSDQPHQTALLTQGNHKQPLKISRNTSRSAMLMEAERGKRQQTT